MPFCPKCRSEYRADIQRCATCDEALVAEEDLPVHMSDQEIIAAMSEEELVSVFEGPLQALKPVQTRLLEAGIPAALRQGEELKTEMGLFIKLQLVVRKDDLEKVAGLVGEEYRENLRREGLLDVATSEGLEHPQSDASEETDGDLACPACGCTDPLVEGECPECGIFLGEE